MSNEKDFSELDKQTFDIDEVMDTDIKINPSYYIHTGMLKAQAALVKDDVKGGFAQYRSIIENLEVLATAAKLLGDDYDSSLKEFLKSTPYVEASNERDTTRASMLLANLKLKLIMKEVFETKTITTPLSDRGKQ